MDNTDNKQDNLGEQPETKKYPKEEGKVQPLKMSREELDRRKETGYSTDAESQRTPSAKGGQASSQGAENE